MPAEKISSPKSATKQAFIHEKFGTPKSDTEKKFFVILSTPADEVGKYQLGNLNFKLFSNGLSLYLNLARSHAHERGRKTSLAKIKLAEEINGHLLAAQQKPESEREAFLYQKLAVLFESGSVKRYGWDNQESQLYLLIEGYLNYYYTHVVIPQSTPEQLVTALNTLSEEGLSEQDKTLRNSILSELTPFLLSNPQSTPSQPTKSNTLLKGKTGVNQGLNDGAKDKSVHNTYRTVLKCLAEHKVKNSDLYNQLLNFQIWYEVQRESFSYTEKKLISQLREQMAQNAQEYKMSLEKKDKELFEHKQTNASLDHQVKTLLQEKKELRKYETENTTLTQQVTQLKEEIARDLKLLEETELRLTEANQQQKNTEHQLEAATTSQEKLKEENAALNKELENQKLQIQQGYVTVKDFTQIKNSAADETASLQKTLAETKQKVAELEEQTELFEDTLKERGAYRDQVEFLATENEQIKKENTELKSNLTILKSFLRSLLSYFNISFFGESQQLKEKISIEQLKAVDCVVLDLLSYQISQLPLLTTPPKFPTRPPLAESLPILQAINKADKNTQARLLQEYPSQMSTLLLKLIGKAISSLNDYDTISFELMKFADQVGQEAIKALKLPKELIQQAQETQYKQLFCKGSNEAIAKERFDRLQAYGSDFSHFMLEKSKGRTLPSTPPASPNLLHNKKPTFFPAVNFSSLNKSTDELENTTPVLRIHG